MQQLAPILGISAGIVTLLAYPPYVRDILKGTTRPARATWIIWTVPSAVALFSQFQAGATWSLLMTAGQFIGALITLILSIRHGVGGYRKRDIASLVIAFSGLALSLTINRPVIALICIVIADSAGALLTIQKAFKDPSSETLSSWWIDFGGNLLGALAVGRFSPVLLLYPVYLCIANGATVLAIYLGRYTIKAAKEP